MESSTRLSIMDKNKTKKRNPEKSIEPPITMPNFLRAVISLSSSTLSSIWLAFSTTFASAFSEPLGIVDFIALFFSIIPTTKIQII